MPITTKPVEYADGDQTCIGFLAWDEEVASARPCVLVSPAWGGLDGFAEDKAVEMAALGYVGFALDVYGDGAKPQTTDARMATMTPFVEDRAMLLTRLKAGMKAAQDLAEVDADYVGMMGFCFGGLCTMDMVRAGVDLKAAISFHGLFREYPSKVKSSDASVLLAHGYDDPMSSPQQMIAVCDEMKATGADWQLLAMGKTSHAFMVPGADDADLGLAHNPKSANRAWMATLTLLDEVFGRHGVAA